jgi:DNA adenine methylase
MTMSVSIQEQIHGFNPKAKSFFGWVGGKSQLTSTIIPLMPEHQCYVEVFAGAAWLLFRKPQSKTEIINDINGDLVCLYRVVQNHLEEFLRYFKWVLISREEFERLKTVSPETLTDIQRSARFYFLIRNAFGAKVTGQTFGVAATGRPRLNLLRLEEELSDAHLRLSQVFIENRPYSQVIKQADRETTFFYVDPPYWDCEDMYGKGLFSKADFTALRDQLATVKGKWLVSINDVPEIRTLFKGFNIKVVPTKYSLSPGKVKPVNELLIANYPWPKS